MSAFDESPPAVHIGLCLTAASTVLLELLLTRLFSVTAGYHFAFMIVSIAMFGMAIGALNTLVRVPPDVESTRIHLLRNAYAFALSIVIVFVLYGLCSHLLIAQHQFLWVTASFILFAVPFYFSGVCTCLCLSRFGDVGRLYSADLLGAAASCVLLIVGLTIANIEFLFSICAVLAAVAGFCFAALKKTKLSTKALIIRGLLIFFCFDSVWLPSPVESAGVKSEIESIQWSPVGRVIVEPFFGPVLTWAKLPLPEVEPLPQKVLCIDYQTYSVMTAGWAKQPQLEPVKQDITAIGNILRPAGSLLVVGAGGGKDVLTGLIYGQKQIDSVELNPLIVSMLHTSYYSFTRFLAGNPGVNILCDEARTWLASSGKNYNLIQCSMVASWAASSSGAFMLSENVLYTKEAFEMYLKHLKPHGILSLLRWGDERAPGQMLRMLNLAKAALNARGVTDIGKHIIMIGAPYRTGGYNIGELLVSPDPFSQEDINKVKQYTQKENFENYWLPGEQCQGVFADFIKGTSNFKPRLPTDDCPFFFTPVLSGVKEPSTTTTSHEQGLYLLLYTLAFAVILVVVTILLPAFSRLQSTLGTREAVAGTALYFGSIGMAYMLVEVGLIERLTVLLGNPAYGLSVVLLSMLSASGIGSFILEGLSTTHDRLKLIKIGAVSSAVLGGAVAVLSLAAIPHLEQFPLWIRIFAAVVMVTPPAFFMGWAFPIGMKHFTAENQTAGPWYWAVNGAVSVLASILAAIISITFGITATLITGAACYVVALAGLRISRSA